MVRQLFSARRGVLGDAEFAKQAVHAQPERALCPRKPVSWSVCLSSLKNTSMLQRQRYGSAMVWRLHGRCRRSLLFGARHQERVQLIPALLSKRYNACDNLIVHQTAL